MTTGERKTCGVDCGCNGFCQRPPDLIYNTPVSPIEAKTQDKYPHLCVYNVSDTGLCICKYCGKQPGDNYLQPESHKTQECLRWVKASDRLPMHMINLSLKINGNPYCGRYDYSTMKFKCPNLSPAGIGIEGVEWLEEVVEPKTQESHANEQVEILRFLLGESRLGGWNFGERPLNAGRYWWRTQIRKVFNDILTRRNP